MSSLARLSSALEIKAVDSGERILEGYAAVSGNLDRTGDIIDPAALQKAAAQPPGQLGVFIGHDMASLPVGVPLELRADSHGLYTRTRVFRTTAGDDLLATATELLAAGKTLGMSIGYRVRDGGAKTERLPDGRRYRKLTDIELVEYSFAAQEAIANPAALVTAVKTVLDQLKAEWTAAFINDLPDSAFAYVEPGGEKDEDERTVPRSKRHFPHHGPDGEVDLPHLRNALARAPQSPLGARALPHLRAHARTEGVGAAAKEGGKALSEGADTEGGALVPPQMAGHEGKPWSVQLRDSQYCVVQSQDGALVACHPTQAEAEAQIAALYASHRPGSEKLADVAEQLAVLAAEVQADESAFERLHPDHKAGRRMSAKDLAAFHERLAGLLEVHDGQCDAEGCPLMGMAKRMRQPAEQHAKDKAVLDWYRYQLDMLMEV